MLVKDKLHCVFKKGFQSVLLETGVHDCTGRGAVVVKSGISALAVLESDHMIKLIDFGNNNWAPGWNENHVVKT